MALQRMGLPVDEAFLLRSPFDLAGGEARRVALAAVAALEPAAWLLDEPTAGLDEHDTAMVSRLIAEEAESGKLVIVAGHDLDRLADWTDRWIVLSEGRLKFDGDPRNAWAQGGLPEYPAEPATVSFWRRHDGHVENIPSLGMDGLMKALSRRRESSR
jgi:energy-coupling factor transporter ATP-binding protein EcfA2